MGTNKQESKHFQNIQNMGQKYGKFADIGHIDYCARPGEFLEQVSLFLQ
jgi:hypothetical protein